MSFYGTVFYEFERLFFKFKFQNVEDTVDTVDINALDSVDGITATERWDTFHIHSGNRWIKLTSMPEGGEVKGLILSHAAAGPAKEETIPFEPIELEEGETATVLDATQAFKVPTITYDNAGHIVSAETSKYQLPDPTEVVQSGMTDYFEEPLDKQGIEHSIEVPEDPEAAGVVVLEPGQIVATTKLSISEKGTVTKVEDVLYKMPASDAEQDFAELSERMDAVEETLEEIPETYATLELTGAIDELYRPEGESAVGSEDRFVSLTTALGNLEDSKLTISPTENLTKSMSVSEQLIAIYKLASGVNEALGNRISTLDAKIKELEKEIETLKNPTE